MWQGFCARPRSSGTFYDSLGQWGPVPPEPQRSGPHLQVLQQQRQDVNIFQGGYMRANDLEFLQEIGIRLVVNVTANIEAPPWMGKPDAPRWWRFIAPEIHPDAPVLPVFETYYSSYYFFPMKSYYLTNAY